MRRKIFVLALAGFVGVLGSCAGAGRAVGAGSGEFSVRVQAAMEDATRPAEDKARDANRLPQETLAFFGIESDDKVVEFLPGGGWYTRLLAAGLDGTGQLYLAFAGRTPDSLFDLPVMKRVKVLDTQTGFEPTDYKGIFEVASFDLGVRDLDAALTFRNLHNLTPDSRANMHKAVFEALRPGGVYGVIDHTRRHNEPFSDANWRRLDPVVVIDEAQKAGFVFEASSNLHYRAKDALRLEVGDKTVTGATDRFTLRFRKSAN